MTNLERKELAVAVIFGAIALPATYAFFGYEGMLWDLALLLGFGILFVYPLMFLPILNGVYHRKRLSETSLEVSEDEIRQVGTDGQILARILRCEPFECDELYREDGHAAYRLRQSIARLDFLSEDPYAEYVVREPLGKEWPPPPPRSFYGH